MDELHIHELRVHESAFEKMPNLLFLKIYTKDWYQKRLITKWDKEWLLPQKLRLLRFDGYPGRCMPSSFGLENLVKLEMRESKLERLWEGVQTLGGLKELVLSGSIYLKEIPDLSNATNLKKLNLEDCSCLVELPSSIQYLNKLEYLWMSGCSSLETLPNGINLQSLNTLFLHNCPQLNSFPDISTNISELYLSQSIDECHSNLSGVNIGMNRITNQTVWARSQPYSLVALFLSDIPSLVELPSSIQNFIKLEYLSISYCINLETLPTGIKFCSLIHLDFSGCSRLRTFPNISTNIEHLSLKETGIKEVPCWIENFTKLKRIIMNNCNSLVRVSLNIYSLKVLEKGDFSNCGALTEASWNGSLIAIDEDLTHQKLQLRFTNLDPEAILQNRSIICNSMVLSGEEVPSYFTHQTTGYSLTNIPISPTSLSQQFFKFRTSVVVGFDDLDYYYPIAICVRSRFKGRLGNSFDAISQNHEFSIFTMDSMLFVFDSFYCIPLAKLNYNQVDMEIHIRPMSSSGKKKYKFKGWGIQLLEECSSPMNRLSNPYKIPHVFEDNFVSENEYNEECVQTIGKRQRETESFDFWEKPFKKMFSYVKNFF